MASSVYAAVDWGTSSFRLWLLDANGNVLAESRGQDGMTQAAAKGFEKTLEDHLERVGAESHVPVIACGMVGAKQGWVEAGYVDVPALLPAVLKAAVKIPYEKRDVRILPGLAQRTSDAPDVIRGEETQLLGAIDATHAVQTVCMPGTHSKWVYLSGEMVTGFSTFMTGELFDAITKHTILSHATAGAEHTKLNIAAFKKAVVAAFEKPGMATNFLFSARSGQILHGLSAAGAAAHISGTLIGLEMAGALSARAQTATITLVASGRLLDLYEKAFDVLSLPYQTVDADTAVRRGLSAAAGSILS
ncbi:2-dehydro-3-deoxygalactonokinase [Oryzifoliimicrobium ureilyticus]|uniref:2-dehydro-3-deoxygalactonokinase n=1 Tax=Oryzifoliimicrobium ureilyticus TaxID=3113724 RepID=UPI003076796F